MNLSKAYNPKEHEDAIYKEWERSGFFNPDNLPGKRTEPFAIMMPPPNVTGILHMGHALEQSLMDAKIRFERMRGKKALLLPGTDHAAVATQSRVEKNLVEQGMAHPREELGRDGLLEKIRDYAEESKATILNQIKKMGTSADWSRLAYTFDADRSRAVNELFVRMYRDGLIYRGYRVINWSVAGQCTCSDDELEHVERPATLYTFRYAKDFPIPIATTRPETKLGDTAVAVHPEDARYRQYIGQTFTVDVGAAASLAIKVIASTDVDPAFGTGALGVTPAHSQTDFAMYEAQKAAGDPIAIIPVIGTDGRMLPAAGERYAGLTVDEARDALVVWLAEQGLMEAEPEEITQNAGTSDRFGDVVEPLPMTQWFVDVNKEIPGRGQSLKDLMRAAVTSGLGDDAAQTVTIDPDRFRKMYLHWIDNLRDWCISRQIWWGHRIPVWYQKSKVESRKSKVDDEVYVGIEHPEGEGWEQDPDTLDTWFSAQLWTFSTLGWPCFAPDGAMQGKPGSADAPQGKFEGDCTDLKTYHPTQWMQMGYEILFFWMARMILASAYTLEEIPFAKAYIHGMVRDKQGRKFSKSLGNGLDPLEITDKYGTDALRYALLSGVTPGNDMRFYDAKVEGAQHLVNKIWNIGRFILANEVESRIKNQESRGDETSPSPSPIRRGDGDDGRTVADRWIMHKLGALTAQVTDDLAQDRFAQAAERLRGFTWDDFADWYVEAKKAEGDSADVLRAVYMELLTLWHPFLPFVTEVLWKAFGGEGLLMVAAWPLLRQGYAGQADNANGGACLPAGRDDAEAVRAFEHMQALVTAIRNARATYQIAPSIKIDAIIASPQHREILRGEENVIAALAGLGRVTITNNAERPPQSIALTAGDTVAYLPVGAILDFDKEQERIKQTIETQMAYVASLEQKLSNDAFRTNAPESVVAEMQQKWETARAELTRLRSFIS